MHAMGKGERGGGGDFAKRCGMESRAAEEHAEAILMHVEAAARAGWSSAGEPSSGTHLTRRILAPLVADGTLARLVHVARHLLRPSQAQGGEDKGEESTGGF